MYSEKQSFRLGYSRVALAIPPAALAFITLRQMVWHHPWGSPPTSDGGLIFLTLLTFLVYLRLMTVRLVTTLRADTLTVGMKGLWRKMKIPVADIASAKSVQFDALAEYGGYGIREGPRGKAYIANGRTAVELELRDGRKFLIGSKTPEELLRQIHIAKRN